MPILRIQGGLFRLCLGANGCVCVKSGSAVRVQLEPAPA